MSEPFLILHCVRGKPAFDIAIQMRCPNCQGVGGHNVEDFETGIITDYEGSDCYLCNGLGYWWIIPTSGHRAYPYWNIALENIDGRWDIDIPVMPPDWPDHYAVNAVPKEPRPQGRELLKQLGLGTKVEVDRRI